MRILGSKFCGHDSAICVIDTKEKNKQIFKSDFIDCNLDELFIKGYRVRRK